jgi:serine/threonine protein kinase
MSPNSHPLDAPRPAAVKVVHPDLAGDAASRRRFALDATPHALTRGAIGTPPFMSPEQVRGTAAAASG